jgi:antitoxin component YwqK of YwqJK toxin-antitoxin module
MGKALYKPITLALIYFLFQSFRSFAQNDTIHFFWNKDLNESKPAKAVYQGISIRDNAIWHLTIFHLTSRKKVVSAYYEDSLLSQHEGLFEAFYDQGEKKTRGYYNESVKAGLWKGWDENGHLTDSTFFENNRIKFSYNWQYSEAHVLKAYQFYRNTGQKVYLTYTDEGILDSEHEFMGKEGTSKIYYSSGRIFQIVKFNDRGDRISLKRFKEDGSELTEKEFQNEIYRNIKIIYIDNNMPPMPFPVIPTAHPDFPGGREQFDKYIRDNLKLPAATNSYGNLSIRFSFYLNRKGKPYKIKLIDPLDKDLEKAIIDLLNSMTAWEMNENEKYGPLVRIINIKR